MSTGLVLLIAISVTLVAIPVCVLVYRNEQQFRSEKRIWKAPATPLPREAKPPKPARVPKPPKPSPGEVARARGDLREALRLYDQVDHHPMVMTILNEDLPHWDASRELACLADALHSLEDSIRIAKTAGILTEDVVPGSFVGEVKAVIWNRAARHAATASHRLETPRLQEALAREAENLRSVRAAVNEIREGLVDLTYDGAERGKSEMKRVQRLTHRLVETKRALQAIEDESLG